MCLHPWVHVYPCIFVTLCSRELKKTLSSSLQRTREEPCPIGGAWHLGLGANIDMLNDDTHTHLKKLHTLKSPNFCVAISFLSIKVVICWFLKTKHTLCHSLGDQPGKIFAPLEVKEYAIVAPSSSFKLLWTILWVLWNHDVSTSLLIATEARIS